MKSIGSQKQPTLAQGTYPPASAPARYIWLTSLRKVVWHAVSCHGKRPCRWYFSPSSLTITIAFRGMSTGVGMAGSGIQLPVCREQGVATHNIESLTELFRRVDVGEVVFLCGVHQGHTGGMLSFTDAPRPPRR